MRACKNCEWHEDTERGIFCTRFHNYPYTSCPHWIEEAPTEINLDAYALGDENILHDGVDNIA